MKRLIATLCLGFATVIAPHTLVAAEHQVVHAVVYSNPNEFAGWPANEGLWQWGDEILVGFEVAAYTERGDNHNVDRDSPKRIAFARSLDGGKTWTPEEHPEIAPPEYLGDPSKHVQVASNIPAPRPHPGGIDFKHPDFAMKLRGSTFYTSSDRGRRWKGPFQLPDLGEKILMARTNYLVVDSQTCRIFLEATSVSPAEGEHGRTMMIETTDGGRTFTFVAWLTPDVLDGQDRSKAFPAFSLMPGVASLDDGTILAAMRNRVAKKKWVDVVASTDAGRTWEKRSLAIDNNNNPASLINLGGERVAMVYGWRGVPYGLRGKISEDGGRTWSDEYVLRDDGREWDLGYVRAARRPDGQVVIVYYHTTESIPQNHIAATIWNPPAPTH